MTLERLDTGRAGPSLAGHYRVLMAAGALTLRRESPRLDIHFSGVRSHDLPAGNGALVLEHLIVGPEAQSFRLVSRETSHHVVARSVQVHEPLPLSKLAPDLPRYPWKRRLLWTVLLAIARFEWGQSLIRRIRRRRR